MNPASSFRFTQTLRTIPAVLSLTILFNLTTYPHDHGAAFAITLSAIVLGTGVAAGLIMKHEFDNKVASQNAALCAQNTFFCNLPTLTSTPRIPHHSFK
jgi:hypothetical protein